MWILRQVAYDSSAPTDLLPGPNDRDLVRVRSRAHLDSIAGSGDELSKIRNLMHWVHNAVRVTTEASTILILATRLI